MKVWVCPFFLLNMKHFDKWLKRLNFGGTEDLSISHMYEHIHTHTQTHQNMLIIMLGRVVGIECDRRLQTKVGWTQVKENVGEREREREREREANENDNFICNSQTGCPNTVVQLKHIA